MTATATIARPATDKQIAFARRLVSERETFLTVETLEDTLREHGMSTKQASSLISALLSAPHRQDARPEAQEGYYVRDDEVFVVVTSKSSGKPYAKQMVVRGGKGKWEYAPGVARDLATLEPLSVEEAARLGRLHGACMICGRTLTVPESVERGIGPVCADKL